MSRFVAEALELPPAPPGRQKLDPREAIERHAPAVAAPAAARAPMRDDEPLRLSSSRIDDYLTCPLKYRYAHEVQVPLARDPGFMYGDALHHALRIYYQHRLQGLPVTADEVVGAFEQAWSSEGFLSREHEERRLAQGRGALRRFVAREDAAAVRPVQVEQTFKFRRGNNVIDGRWDRIDQRHDGIVIVDFKTADVAKQEDADTRAKQSLRDSQLGLYALAYREARGVAPAGVELQFVESGVAGYAAVEDKHLDAALERIDAAAAGIRAADFTPRPEYNACRYCPYSNFCPHTATRSGA
jgi:DNA helicase-2/ATP-dependent DNA helicase PcrA